MTGTVLLTGFAPFDGQAENASWLGAQYAAELWNGPGTVATMCPVRAYEAVKLPAPDVAAALPKYSQRTHIAACGAVAPSTSIVPVRLA